LEETFDVGIPVLQEVIYGSDCYMCRLWVERNTTITTLVLNYEHNPYVMIYVACNDGLLEIVCLRVWSAWYSKVECKEGKGGGGSVAGKSKVEVMAYLKKN
jgi:hypothetical protein